MPDRYRVNKNNTPSRKDRKLRFIKMKNRIREGNGVYYTYHLEDETTRDFHTWIDVYFLSEKYKNRYFSAALTTPDCIASDMVQDKAIKEAYELMPMLDEDKFFESEKIPRKSPKDPILYRMILKEDAKKRHELINELEAKYSEDEFSVQCEIEIDQGYWGPAIGFHATVNTPSLTPEAIIEFIKMYRALGEPLPSTERGVVWVGEEVKRVPAEFNRRYKEARDAQSSGD